jgi:hypothetical protein
MLALAALGIGAISPLTASAAEPNEPAPMKAPATAPTPHGFVQMIGEALAEVTVMEDQEADIEELGARLDPLEAEVDKAEANLLYRLGDQVKAGTINRAALAPEIAAYVTARDDLAVPLRDALEELHEMLDKQQRADFVDALECSVHEVTREILSRDKLDAFVDKLKLDPVQTGEVRDAFQDILPMLQSERRNMHDALESFRGDFFSLDPYFPLEQVHAKSERRANRMIDVTETMLGVLDHDQADKLAQAIHDAAEAKLQGPSTSATAEPPKTEEKVDIEVRRWAAGRVRGWGPVRRPWVGRAAGFYGARVAPFPVVAVYGWGL